MGKKIFLICPIRNATLDQKQRMAQYIYNLENMGNKVYYPARDTNQVDPTGGWNICTANKNAIEESDEVHIFWDDSSIGSIFDLGMSFAFGKRLCVVNPENINIDNKKSFHNVIDYWRKIE